jgi:hypothetical protein
LRLRFNVKEPNERHTYEILSLHDVLIVSRGKFTPLTMASPRLAMKDALPLRVDCGTHHGDPVQFQVFKKSSAPARDFAIIYIPTTQPAAAPARKNSRSSLYIGSVDPVL